MPVICRLNASRERKKNGTIYLIRAFPRSQPMYSPETERENWMTELNKMNGRTRNIILWLCSTLEHIFNFDNPFIVDWIQHTNTASSGYHPECALHSYAPDDEWSGTKNWMEHTVEKKIHCVLFVRNHKRTSLALAASCSIPI